MTIVKLVGTSLRLSGVGSSAVVLHADLKLDSGINQSIAKLALELNVKETELIMFGFGKSAKALDKRTYVRAVETAGLAVEFGPGAFDVEFGDKGQTQVIGQTPIRDLQKYWKNESLGKILDEITTDRLVAAAA